VGVAHALVDGAPAQPFDGEGAGPGTRHRVVGGDVDRHAPVAQAVAADVRQACVGRAEGGVARGAAALGEDDRGVGDHRQNHGDRDDRRGTQAQGRRPLLGAGLEDCRAGGDEGEQRQHGEALRGGVAGVQRAHRAEGRGGGARERPRAERDRHGAQLWPGALEGDERGEAGQQARDRATREAQVGTHAQWGGGRRGGDAQRAGSRHVAGEARAEHEPDRRQRAGGVPIGQRLLEAPAGARGRVQVHHIGQQPAAQAIADDDERPGGQRGLDHPRRAPV
jgi:hypothetical protein